MEDNIFCPLVDMNIDEIDCIENIDIVDGLIVKSAMPEKFKKKSNWIEICEKCKNHNY